MQDLTKTNGEKKIHSMGLIRLKKLGQGGGREAAVDRLAVSQQAAGAGRQDANVNVHRE